VLVRRVQLVLLAAWLALAGMGLREAAAAWHHHPHEEASATCHHHGEDESEPDAEHADCVICAAVCQRVDPPAPPDRVVESEPACGIVDELDVRAPILTALAPRCARGPPAARGVPIV
jgi:hypothetical protein